MVSFAPRDAPAAARWLRAVLALSAVLLGVTTAVEPPSTALTLVICVVTISLCLAGVFAVGRGWSPGGRSWALAALGTPALVLLADLATGDATLTGQIFFVLPSLVAGSQLHARAAWVTTAVCSLGELVLVLARLAPGTAVLDWLHVTAVITVVAFLQVRAADRADDLTAELRRQVAIDPLTGLVTRRVLDDAASAALSGATSAVGTALVIVDLDHFKDVNDTHGHPVGDRALVHVAALLVRAAGPGAVVSRLGGDELAVLLPACGLAVAEGRAEDAAELVRSTPLPLRGGGACPLTVSVGVAHSPRHALDVEALYRAADAALYASKRAGRDRVSTADQAPAPAPLPLLP